LDCGSGAEKLSPFRWSGRGAALADFTYQSFAEASARRLEELRASAEEARIEAQSFVEHPPTAAELDRAIRYIREHWQRRYGLALIG